MREAGMSAHFDAIGNVCGRYEGDLPGLPCLMLGSHYDTMRDAGKCDGIVGLITAIPCVAPSGRVGLQEQASAGPSEAGRNAAIAAITDLKDGKPILTGEVKSNTGKVITSKDTPLCDPSLEATDYLVEGIIGTV
jgi:hypothetical protein